MTTPSSNVPSPCIDICQMNADSGLCEGCFRTLDEITRWSGEDDPGKLGILAEVELRRDAAFSDTPVAMAGGQS